MTQKSNAKSLSKLDCIDFLGILAIALYSLGASLFDSNFAEIHIQLSFFNFPIFISELLLCFCLILLFLKLWITQGFRRWHWLWAVYFGWVIILALVGYLQWGPLSFRNAALFYYPWFALLGYSFYNQRIFANRTLIIPIFLILVFLIGFSQIQTYCWGTHLLLILVIIFKIFLSPWHFLAIVFVLVCSHLDNLFIGSRTHMVAIWGATLFLIFINRDFIYKIPFKTRLCLIAISLIIFALGVTKISDQNAIKSLVGWNTIVKLYKEEQQHIHILKKKQSYASEFLAYNLYNPNAPDSLTNDLNRRKARLNSLLDQKKSSNSLQDQPTEPSDVSPVSSGVVQVSRKLEQLPEQSPEKQFPKVLQDQPTGSLHVSPVSSRARKLEQLPEQSPEKQFFKVLQDQPTGSLHVSPVSSRVVQASRKSEQSPEQTFEMNEAAQGASNVTGATHRDLGIAYNNILFRIFIWEDMFDELWLKRKFFGVGFGQPQRSPSLEALEWGFGEWSRDGWITPHNSFFHIIYRTGVLGIGLIFLLFTLIIRLAADFYRMKSVEGRFLVGALIYWLILSNFLVILELPYNAVLFWSLFGLTWAYRDQLQAKVVK